MVIRGMYPFGVPIIRTIVTNTLNRVDPCYVINICLFLNRLDIICPYFHFL